MAEGLVERYAGVGKGSGEVGFDSEFTDEHRPRRKIIRSILELNRQRRATQKQRAAEKKRLKHLEDVERREPETWQQVIALIEKKLPSAYDEAMPLLSDLRDLADLRNRREAFDAHVREIAATYRNRPALLGRLRERGLLR